MSDSWTYQPPHDPLQVLHHDRDTLAIDKPSGLLSVPGRGPELHDSALSRAMTDHGTVYPVHRLDLDTSGVMLFATRRKAERELFRQFRARTVQKVYVAVVHGQMKADEGRIELPLRRLDGMPRSVVCHASGRPSVTTYTVTSRTPDTTCVTLFPETGRSHQLRVHLMAIGHPILGDRFYAPPDVVAAAPRLLLHARDLFIDHPFSGTRLHLSAPAPFPPHPLHLEPSR